MSGQPEINREQMVKKVEHVLLSPVLTEAETVAGSELAGEMGLAGVVVKPCFVHPAVTVLKGSEVIVGTVIGFPHGSNTAHVKIHEAKRALTEGALVLELVLNHGYLRGGMLDHVRQDIRAVCGLAHMNGARLRVIIESGILTDQELIKACKMIAAEGADGVVAGTGYGPQSASLREIDLIRKAVGGGIPIKAQGGIQVVSDVIAFLDAGCSRVGVGDLAEVLGG